MMLVLPKSSFVGHHVASIHGISNVHDAPASKHDSSKSRTNPARTSLAHAVSHMGGKLLGNQQPNVVPLCPTVTLDCAPKMDAVARNEWDGVRMLVLKRSEAHGCLLHHGPQQFSTADVEGAFVRLAQRGRAREMFVVALPLLSAR